MDQSDQFKRKGTKYAVAREAIEDFFPDWGHDCESALEDANGDTWDSLVVMKVFYIRLKDGKLRTGGRHPELLTKEELDNL